MKAQVTIRDTSTVDVTLTLSLDVLLATIAKLEKDSKPAYRPTKLNLNQMLEVKRLHASGTKYKDLAIMFGVSVATVSRIVNKPIPTTIQ